MLHTEQFISNSCDIKKNNHHLFSTGCVGSYIVQWEAELRIDVAGADTHANMKPITHFCLGKVMVCDFSCITSPGKAPVQLL